MALFSWIERTLRKQVFTRIYLQNRWAAKETVSGPGSTLQYTEGLRRQLPVLLRSLQVKSLLDVPCGDFHWMQHVDLSGIRYTGGDIVKKLVDQNRSRFPQHRFIQVDIVADPLPQADLLMTRDCFIHLSNKQVLAALQNIKASGTPYLLTNNYPQVQCNEDIKSGSFRMINFQLPPFNFPGPAAQISDYIEGFPERHLALWKISELPI